jgi:hypothetical protein
MVAGIVGSAGVLFNDDPLRVPGATAYFWIHIVLAIAAWRKAPLAILKLTPTYISREGFAPMLLNGFQ